MSAARDGGGRIKRPIGQLTELSGGRFVFLAALDGGQVAICFRAADGEDTRFRLTVEAWAALRSMIPTYESGTTPLPPKIPAAEAYAWAEVIEARSPPEATP